MKLHRIGSKSRRQKKIINELESRELPRSGIVTVYVLITSMQTALRGSHSLSLFTHLSAHSQTASAVQTLALPHCHTPHWLPWRNSPPGLQGTRVYCLWLLYLDENMICWKGSTCFFPSPLLFAAAAFFFHLLTSINATLSHDVHCFILLLSRSLPFFFFFAHVCVKLA